MNYLKIYCSLIRKAENRTLPEDYTEKHHTFPKSIFGNNSRIVVLTAREHYIAHALLERICIKRYGVNHIRTQKMICAHIFMKGGKYYNSYLYETAKIRYINNMMGENNHFYGKTHSQETIEKMRKIKTGKIQSQETRDKIAATKIGISRSQETIEKIKKANIGKTLSQETKDKISAAISGENHYLFGKTLSQETKNKISVGISGENNPKSNWWRITFSNGKVIERCGLSNWVKENGYNNGALYEVYKKIRKKHKDIVAVEKIENKSLHKINDDV
jgi:hypothetical protein